MAEGDRWERELRRSLADRAGGIRHPRADLAGVAIARGARARRRRSVLGMAAVLLGTLLATGALLQDWDGGADEPAEYGAVTGQQDGAERTGDPTDVVGLAADRRVAVEVAVDVIGDGTSGGLVLATGDGQQLDLGSIRQVASAHRLGSGWAVVGGEPGTTRLWWVTRERAPLSLLAGMDAIVVEQGQVAWQRGALLAAGRLSGTGELTDLVSTAAPRGDGEPVGFLDDAVLLARTESNGWDTWHPARGDYQPGWTDQVLRVYGSLPDGPAAVGLVPPESGADGACLAHLDEELVPSRVSCVPEELPADGPAAVSPQGRWLLISAPDDRLLVDLVEVFDPQLADAAVTEVAGVSVPVAAPVWLGPDRVVFATSDRLVQLWPDRLRVGANDAIQQVALRGNAPVLVKPI